MSGINKVILVGNLGKDPEVRELDSGVVVAKFPLATSESFNNKEGARVDQTEWHNIVLWRGLAEVAERFLRKGSLVYLEGKLKTRSWDDKEGHRKYITEVVADNLTILSKRYKDDGELSSENDSYNNDEQTNNNSDSSS